jgi:hypothetical protein
MFIPMLTPEQQEALCRIVRFVARIDDNNPVRGDVLVAKLEQESLLTEIPPPAADMDEVKRHLDVFNTPLSKRALVLECLGVALADLVAHPDEVKAIEAIGEGLGLDGAWVERARDYVQRAIEVQREGQDLLQS